ncbi:Cupredoxin [Chytriomyces sp. MP71]|nr:Cupredoxin [Chytriomyces sp. MP71]
MRYAVLRFSSGFRLIFASTLYLIISVAHAKTIEQFWNISNFSQDLGGVERMALGVNGKPGHISSIKDKRGDRLIIHFTNHLNMSTSLHIHGFFRHDPTSCPVAPGHTFTYEMMLDFVSSKLLDSQHSFQD